MDGLNTLRARLAAAIGGRSFRTERDALEERVRCLTAITTKKIDYDSEDGRFAAQIAGEVVPYMGSLLCAFLCEHGAENYVEMQFHDRQTMQMYTVTVQRVIGGKTPHQLREQAERDRDVLRTALDAALGVVPTLAPSPPESK